MLSPELLLLDEPFGALDPLVRASSAKGSERNFRALAADRVLRDPRFAEAAYLGDEIVLMNEGHIVQRGSIADLRAKPANAFVSRIYQRTTRCCGHMRRIGRSGKTEIGTP